MKWDKFFKRHADNSRKFTCTLCQGSKAVFTQSKDNGTSNFLKHLNTKHQAEYKKFVDELGAAKKEEDDHKRKSKLAFGSEPALKQARLDEVGAKWPDDYEKSVTYDKLILNLLISASLPITFVENEDFKALLKFATGGRYNLRSRHYFAKTAIPKAFDEKKDQLALNLKDQPYVSLTADGWHSNNATHSLLGVTCHWITSDFKLNSAALGTIPVKGKHTAANYEELLKNAMEEMKIDDKKVHMLVTDGAATMVRLSRNMQVKNSHCFSHNMQLAVNNFCSSIPGWNETYTAMGKITRRLHKSSTSREDYVSCLKYNDLAIRFLPTATEVRWGSMFLLCERFIHARVAIQKLLIEWDKEPLTEAMWKQIELVKETLKPINDVTKIVQHSSAAQNSVIIPYVRLLLMTYEDREGCEYSSTIYTELKYRLEHYLHDETLMLGTAVDPRFKLDYLLGDGAITVQALLEALVYEEMKKEKDESPTVLTSQELRKIIEEDNVLEKFRMRHAQKVLPSPDLPESELKQAASREVQYYLSERADHSIDCFKYWNDNKHKFPTLALLARKYLSAPSTSSESERLFSAARLILSDYRMGMNPQTLEKLLYLKINSKVKDTNNNP